MYIFRKKIKCVYCGKNHRGKTEKRKKVYICSTYSNKGMSYCKRNQVEEEELIYIIVKHLSLQKISIENRKDIREYVDIIEVEEGKIQILYIDGTGSLISNNKIIY